MTDADVKARRDALAERFFNATIETFDLFHVYLGMRLGLYRVLAEHPDMTSAELANAAGVAERYAREWLEQQAVTGILDVAVDGDDATRRYRLPLGHDTVLLDEEHLSYVAPLALGTVGVASVLPAVEEAFRAGGGVPYEAYGDDVRNAIAWLNRPMFLRQLGTEWFPAIPEVNARLLSDPPARVADVGCGTGWSSIAMGRAYPKISVEGLDLDAASIDEARQNAAASGVSDRVTFEVRNAADPQLAGRYDLVCAFETIHDMADPVAALRAMRSLRADDGTVLVADEKVAEEFVAPGDEVERFNYGWSALHCLPVGMVDPPATGTGTVMRPATFRNYATDAGFSDVEILPVEHDLWRFYRLHG